MDTLTILVAINSIALIVLVIALLARRKVPPVDADKLRAELALAVTDRLARFEQNVRTTVEAAKKEVTTSKDAIDKNAVALTTFMANMGQTIQKLSSQQEIAARISEDLKFVLEGPKSRGTFGETILEELLDRTVPGIWDRQVAIDGREAVDAAIVLKGTTYPIDAKFPKEDYQRFLRAGTPEEKAETWKAHVGAVKAQIDSISRKYVRPELGTAQFALMFIPSEGMYYDTIADTDPFGETNRLMEYAYQQRVVPVGPTTLFAFLQVIAKAQEGQRLVDNARQLFEQLGNIRKSFDKFYAKYDDVGKAIAKASDAHRLGDGHIQRFRDRVEDTLTLNFAIPDEGALETPAPVPVLAAPEPVVGMREPTQTPQATNGDLEAQKAILRAAPSTPAPVRKGKAAFKVED